MFAGHVGAGLVIGRIERRVNVGIFIAAALLIGMAVFSHWLLDALVHQPELPLAGAGSPKIGLGLWRSMPVALAVEAAIVVVGLLLYARGSSLTRAKPLALTLVLICALAWWLGRVPRAC